MHYRILLSKMIIKTDMASHCYIRLLGARKRAENGTASFTFAFYN